MLSVSSISTLSCLSNSLYHSIFPHLRLLVLPSTFLYPHASPFTSTNHQAEDETDASLQSLPLTISELDASKGAHCLSHVFLVLDSKLLLTPFRFRFYTLEQATPSCTLAKR